MNQYTVIVEYKGQVTVRVIASDEKNAEIKALREAEDSIGANLNVMNVTITPDFPEPCPK